MACTLAESPSDPLHRKLRQLRCLRCRFDCYRVERTSSRAGVTPAEVQAPFHGALYRQSFAKGRFCIGDCPLASSSLREFQPSTAFGVWRQFRWEHTENE